MSALLSTFGIDWQLLLAQGVNFIVLVVLLTWLLYKPVLKIVAERQAVITKGVIDAERATQELKDMDARVARHLHKAENEAEEILASARTASVSEKTRLLKEAEDRAALIAKDADTRAEETLSRARRESESEIARLAMLATEKMLNQQK